MELMPQDIRAEIIVKLEAVINEYKLVRSNITNIRNSSTIDQVTADTIIDYYEFMKAYTVPDNVEELRFKLVAFLQSFEQLRNNTITDYAPRYKDFLRSYNY
jgi:hypothetical protein